MAQEINIRATDLYLKRRQAEIDRLAQEIGNTVAHAIARMLNG